MEQAKRPDAGPFYLSAVFALLLVPAALGSSQTIFNDGDVSWHIATGQWILDHRTIPTTDPFSFTWAGKPWVAIEWLAESLYASAYRLGGYSGVAALVTAALMALHAIVFLNAARFLRSWSAIGAVVAMDVVLIPMMLARPHLLTWPLLALWTWLMMRARERDSAPPLAAALIMTPWANLHGGFVFGLLIAALFGFEALMAAPDRMRVVRQWGLFGLACALAVCINGNGLEGVVHPVRFTGLKMLPFIDEWKPSSLSATPVFFVVLALTLALIAWKRPRLPWVRWLLLGGMLGLALLQVRHQAMLAIIAAVILPQGFARGAEVSLEAERRRVMRLALPAMLALVAVRAVMPMQLPDNEANPWKLIAAVPADLRSQPVLNAYSMGGPLILSGIRPYVDGRGDMYGDELVLDYVRIIRGNSSAFDAAVRRWNIRWVILSDQNRKLIAVLDGSPDWRRLYRDKVGVIYVRRADAQPSAS
ncbi:hypothetical protein [Sphingomonas sp. URHD0057]|uniref:hypothetical protein n=1 Tax=Sphingomonas sp. URHD0057 TaxID=1380389 RepID=UPI0004919170|nr:hypothetical protein [Sphingomonas sp. URHD0057]